MAGFNVAIAAGVFAAAALSTTAGAATLTHGTLTTDTAGVTITDTATGRDYGRFDATTLSLDALSLELGPGGIWDGWAIADSGIADDFIAALIAPGALGCPGPTANTACGAPGGPDPWADGNFGGNVDAELDVVYFRNSFAGSFGFDFGEITIRTVGGGLVARSEEAFDIGTGAGLVSSSSPQPYLLYRDPVTPPPSIIPLPAGGVLLVSAVAIFYAGAVGRRRA